MAGVAPDGPRPGHTGRVRIALDLRYRVSSGASTYIHALVPELIDCAPATAEFFYVRYAGQDLDRLPERPSIEVPLGSALKEFRWTNWTLPAELRRREIGLYHGMKLFGPLKCEIPMVHTVHSITTPRGGEFPMSPKQRIIHTYGNALFRRSCRVIGVSRYVSRFLVDQVGVSEERMRTIHLGVPPAFREAVSSADGPVFDTPGLGGAPYIVCVGNVEYVKNHAAAVRALARIKERVPHHLVIAGRADKPAASDLRRLIDSEQLTDRVHLPGFLDLPSLAACMARADLQIHPSLSEGFCLSVLEGMCAGVPIIGSGIPGVTEVLGETGLTIDDPRDDGALADAVVKWLTHPDEAQRSAEKGRERARQFGWTSAARETLAVYDECLG